MAKHIKKDKFAFDEEAKQSDKVKVIKSNVMESMKGYDNDFSFKKWDGKNPLTITTEKDLIECLENNPNVDIEARFYAFNRKTKEAELFKANKETFLEVFKGNKKKNFRETVDYFQNDFNDMSQGSQIIGDPDYTPMIGGPFAKSLYYYDFLQMAGSAFYAINNDPFAKRITDTIVHFTIGKGFRSDCEDKSMLALWEAFVEVNDLDGMIKKIAREIIPYGEHMVYWLPNHETKINYQPNGLKPIDKGLLPRIRLLDPTTIWEVITAPEDITNVYAYKQIFPTQYQIYTVEGVPATKFIYQQLPADAVMHFKVNAADNEKRGRSDLYPILGYLKRMRDVINYELVKKLKNAAWCIDTTIDGDQTDVDSYVTSQQAMGTIPTAGSEFVHSKKVERDYMGNQTSGMGSDSSFEIILSAIAAGSLPISYFGTHLSGGSTRAGAVVSTEPVQKFFEDRQGLYETILIAISRRFFKNVGRPDVKIEFTFPEIFTQDRSAKLKDLALAVSEQFISKKRAAAIVAKEFGITDFDYAKELEEIKKDPPQQSFGGQSFDNTETPLSNKGISSDERKDAKDTSYAKTT